ncbi:chain A, Nudix Hydrolase From Nitrosomonas Europaea [Teredinibacter turnerae T7901]|uniref:Phosphatase NudJ n=1 Tax=Teredinibacter turnerae (strain ATCC 39867 / T7901) TaxID=377629 RepID=C5BIJ0_TERTT|nr:NUDIX hydrolase [Teredinibacter turnerae]ACR11429.1 chain A, Nudix Hydrolase From Nitrosomonas Europaea [Teredinibacter turnerae T7901]
MVWHAHVTVATVVEKGGKFLMVQESSAGKTVINQPAGHLEENETLIAAAERETLEETQWEVKVTHLLGTSLYKAPQNGITYFRVSYIAEPFAFREQSPLDSDIECALWLSKEDLLTKEELLRSPMVMRDIERYLAGDRFPLDVHRDFTTK